MSGLSRRDFEKLWERFDADAQAAKFSHEAVLRLTSYYRSLDEEDRGIVDEALTAWVLEGDERRRFDALALIDEFSIRSALPALEEDLARLRDATGASVPTDGGVEINKRGRPKSPTYTSFPGITSGSSTSRSTRGGASAARPIRAPGAAPATQAAVPFLASGASFPMNCTQAPNATSPYCGRPNNSLASQIIREVGITIGITIVTAGAGLVVEATGWTIRGAWLARSASAASRSTRAAKAADGILPTPQVGSTKLQNLVDNLYKGTTHPNRVGNGTTMDAIRNEIATGVPTGGRMHTTKGRETLRRLDNWLRRNPNADYDDRLVAQSIADELSGVLRGAP